MAAKFAGLAALIGSVATGVNAGAVELTPDNFDDQVSGKGAFIKFLAPW